MCRTCWIFVVLLGLVTTGMAYKFIIQGSVAPSSDGRTALLLEEGERDLVLAEMRAFLDSVQKITNGISVNYQRMKLNSLHILTIIRAYCQIIKISIVILVTLKQTL